MGLKRGVLLLLALSLAVPSMAQNEGAQVASALSTAANQLWAMVMQALPVLFPLFALLLGIGVVQMLLKRVTR
jgi:sorbitol-specific phosphotransferase system component IIBC